MGQLDMYLFIKFNEVLARICNKTYSIKMRWKLGNKYINNTIEDTLQQLNSLCIFGKQI